MAKTKNGFGAVELIVVITVLAVVIAGTLRFLHFFKHAHKPPTMAQEAKKTEPPKSAKKEEKQIAIPAVKTCPQGWTMVGVNFSTQEIICQENMMLVFGGAFLALEGSGKSTQCSQPNPLTGNCSCPSTFTEFNLSKASRSGRSDAGKICLRGYTTSPTANF